jgi:NADPH:quinone reductase-like Zn-dependent oxidoreductase
MRLWRLPRAEGIDSLTLCEEPPPAPHPARGQALVRLRAFSLNRRDLGVAAGTYRGG